VLVNVGMTLGVMPITGIPLPFVSFGGNSLLTNAVGIGLLESIAMRRQKIMF
jgi:rod shape determining protein RodA